MSPGVAAFQRLTGSAAPSNPSSARRGIPSQSPDTRHA